MKHPGAGALFRLEDVSRETFFVFQLNVFENVSWGISYGMIMVFKNKYIYYYRYYKIEIICTITE